MWTNIYIGVAVLHASRFLALLIIQIYSYSPDYWHWITLLLLLGITGLVYAKVPNPKRDYLRLTNRMQIALSGLVAGLLLGASYAI